MELVRMKNLAEIQKTIKNLKMELEKVYHVNNIGIFGSFAHGEADAASDIDILVEFSESVGFFHFLELEEFLENRLGRKVDLVTKKALKPYIGKKILEEVIMV